MQLGSPRIPRHLPSVIVLLGAIAVLATAVPCRAADAPPASVKGPKIDQTSESGIKHSFFAAGSDTYIAQEDGTILWHYEFDTRDGWILPDGHVLMAVSTCAKYPHGAVVEVDREHENKVVFEFPGTQAEVATVEATDDGKHILLVEEGPKPRLMEVDKATSKVLVDFPLKCQTSDFHMQTRMARKLKNGNYLVPHLLEKVVREYKPDGTIAWEVATPNWPFTAIRLEDGHTMINCTVGNEVIEVDKDGKIVWDLTNKDLGADLIKDACGGQRLANGNTVITSYRTAPGEVRMLEVTPEKKVVWSLKSDQPHGVHEFQILGTNGKPFDVVPQK